METVQLESLLSQSIEIYIRIRSRLLYLIERRMDLQLSNPHYFLEMRFSRNRVKESFVWSLG